MKQQYEMNKSEVLWRMSAQNFKSLLITASHQSTGHMDLYESLNFVAGFFCRSQVTGHCFTNTESIPNTCKS